MPVCGSKGHRQGRGGPHIVPLPIESQYGRGRRQREDYEIYASLNENGKFVKYQQKRSQVRGTGNNVRGIFGLFHSRCPAIYQAGMVDVPRIPQPKQRMTGLWSTRNRAAAIPAAVSVVTGRGSPP